MQRCCSSRRHILILLLTLSLIWTSLTRSRQAVLVPKPGAEETWISGSACSSMMQPALEITIGVMETLLTCLMDFSSGKVPGRQGVCREDIKGKSARIDGSRRHVGCLFVTKRYGPNYDTHRYGLMGSGVYRWSRAVVCFTMEISCSGTDLEKAFEARRSFLLVLLGRAVWTSHFSEYLTVVHIRCVF